MKVLRITLLVLLAILVFMQLIPAKKNISTSEQPHQLALQYEVPQDVNLVLQKACNDCHSNNTKYPWYNNIQPVAFFLQEHIEDGKKHLNFDEFLSYTPKKQAHKLEEVVEMIEKGEMPLKSYTLIHGDARLNNNEKSLLINWAKNLRQKILAENVLPTED